MYIYVCIKEREDERIIIIKPLSKVIILEL